MVNNKWRKREILVLMSGLKELYGVLNHKFVKVNKKISLKIDIITLWCRGL